MEKKTLFLPIHQFFATHNSILKYLSKYFSLIVPKNDRLKSEHCPNVEYVEDIIGPIDGNDIGMSYFWEMNEFISFTKDILKDLIPSEIDQKDFKEYINYYYPALYANYFHVWQFNRLTEKRTIDMVIVSADYAGNSRSIVIEARKKRIPTVNIDHGNSCIALDPDAFLSDIYVGHPSVSDFLIRDNNLEVAIINKHLIKRGYVSRSIPLPLGTPLDDVKNQSLGKRAARKQLKLDPDKYTVVLTGSWEELRRPSCAFQYQIDEASFYELAFRELKDLVSSDNAQIIVKLHPAIAAFGEEEGVRRFIQELAGRFFEKPVLVTTGSKNEILEASDIIIVFGLGSIAWEAILQERPPAVVPSSALLNSVDSSRLSESSELCRNGLVEFILHDGDLKLFSEKYLNVAEQDAFVLRKNAFLEKWHIKDVPVEEKCMNICRWIGSVLGCDIAADGPMKHSDTAIRASIIIPLYRQPEYSKRCLEAIVANTPQDLYELILVDNGSCDTTQALIANQPATTKIIHNQENQGFARACNQGAKAAACEYLLFLNNDTEPQLECLEALVEILDHDDSVAAVGSKLLYPDGKIQHAGIVVVDDRKNDDPLLARNNHVGKHADAPEANTPTLHQALTAACVLIRKSAFTKVGGFDEKYWNGYEDVDLCFKLQEQGWKLVYQPASVVIHHESQSGPERFSKAPDNIAQLHKKWLGKIKPDIILNEDGAVTLTDAGKIRPYSAPGLPQKLLKPKASTPQPNLASIVVLTFNELKYTRECIESIRKHTPEQHEIIFIDNASTDGTLKWLRKISRENPNYKLIENKKNLGFAKGCNQGIEASSGEFILLLNNDVVVTENWLSGMLECLNSAPDTGVVGPMTNNISGPQKVSDGDYRTKNRMIEYAESFRKRYRHRRVSFRRIVGFCMLFRRALVDEIGLLDESFGTGNFEDDDYCLRATLAGCRNLIAGDVFIHHYGSRSFIGNRIDYGSQMSGNIKIFDEKWTGIDVNTPLGKKVAAFNFIEKADALNQKGQLDKAIAMCIEGIKYAPEEKAVYFRLAEMLLDAKLYKDALEAVQSMPWEAGDDLKRLEIIAYCTEGPEEAGKLADRILTVDKDYAAAMNLKGINAYKQSDSSAAEDFFKKAIASDPGYGEPHTNLGIMKWAADQKEEALDCLEKGFILSPTLTDNVTLYHSAITALERFERAEKLFQDAKELHPENKRILFFLIDIFIKQGKFDAAMHEIEQAMLDIGIDDGMVSAALEIREKVGTKKIDKASKDKGFLSLCMIVKNEEQHLTRCLLSAKPAVDEMIVVDTGSTDRTKDIAKAFGAKVFDFPWTNDFSEARNYSLSKASGDWILVLDADEVISPLDYASIEKLMKKGASKPVAYTLVTRNYTNEVNSKGWVANDRIYRREEAGTGWFPSAKVRLFVNDKRIQFQNPVHEFVEASLEKAGIEIKTSSIPVHHYGRFDRDKLIAKGREYFLLGKKKIEEMKGDIKALRELAIQASELGEYDTAVELWKKVIELNLNDPVAFLNIGYAYMKLEKYHEAHTSSRRAMELDPAMKEAALNYAGTEFIIGDVKKSISVLEALLRMDPDYPPAVALVAAAYYVEGQKEKGLDLFEKLRKKTFGCADLLDEQTRGLMSQGRFDQAVSLLDAAIKTGNINKDTHTLLAECQSKR